MSFHGRRWAILSTPLILLVLAACGPNTKIAGMTDSNAHLNSLLEKPKTVCFGRFAIDVPRETEIVWGDASIPLDARIYRDAAPELSHMVAEREASLKAQARYPKQQGLNLYFETLQGGAANQRLVVSQENFSSEGILRIESYSALGNDLVWMEARPLEERKAAALVKLNDLAVRLRSRNELEMPSEPGICIEHAFLPDSAGSENRATSTEHIRIGFRLKAFPDVHLSIYTAGANLRDPQGDSLKRQLERTESEASQTGRPNPFSSLKTLRRGPRQIQDWSTGYEFLTRRPEEKESRAHQDFWLKFTGEPHSALRPYVDIQLRTGVDGNATGKVKSSLTDEEAVALWDKLTSSIRVRPVTTAPTRKTSDASPMLPLGELAVTGRICPQSGVWQCVDEGQIQGGRRRHFNAGEVMPAIVQEGQQTLVQRLKGEQATHRSATVWKLVDYDET